MNKRQHGQGVEPGRSDLAAMEVTRRPPPRRRRALVALLLFVGSLTLYLSNGKTLDLSMGGDTIPNRLIPFSILRFGTVTLEPFRDAFTQRGGYRWYVQERKETLVSYYPLGTAIIALPFYFPLFLFLVLTGRSSAEDLFAFSEQAEKLTASTMTALAVVLIWVVLTRRTSLTRATWTATILATCTLLWPIGSQVLWQHSAGVLLFAAALLLIASPGDRWRPFLIGLLFGLWFAVRPQAVLFGLSAAVGIFLTAPSEHQEKLRSLISYCTGFALPAIPALVYTRHFYGTWLGGYGSATALFSTPWVVVEGIQGMLISANRGLFVLAPVTLWGVAGALRVLREPRREPMLAALTGGAVLYFLLHAATATWAGGWCFGPRYLTETLPLLAVTSSLAATPTRAVSRALLTLAVFWSFAIQASGAYFYPLSNWHGRAGPDLERAAWDWGHFMPWEDFQAWRRTRDAKPSQDGRGRVTGSGQESAAVVGAPNFQARVAPK